MDRETGACVLSIPDASDTNNCWSRGQAWAIYGMVLGYNYSEDFGKIELTKKLTNYYINRLPDDGVPCWNLQETQHSYDLRDSSAAAIATCGILELVKHLPLADEDKRLYEHVALHTIQSLTEHYTTRDIPDSNGVLQHGMGSKDHYGHDECLIYADYFYFEALVRLKKDWKLYW